MIYLTNYDKSILFKLNALGEKIRQSRESQGLLLRQAAAFLEVDTALVSKLERGERRPQKEQVIKLAAFLKMKPDELLMLWMADKITDFITDDELGMKALDLVKKNLAKNNFTEEK
ncbi:MAG: transcriptional regulator [Segetibacter sp.]|nr:transcriptional regulator [Bacteroidota bacterium]MCW3111553.1 transcriptional regulator [Segetibacter sp.]